MAEVTDPAVLAQLNGASAEVTDPDILAQLNASPASTPTKYTITGSQSPPNPQYPVGNELADFAANAWTGIGSFWPNLGLRARQAYNAVTGGPSLAPEVAETRKLDEPLMSTVGGKVGSVLPYAGLMSVAPGAGTMAGAVGYGALSGAAQPTVSSQETLKNTVLGGALGGAGKLAGDALSSWVTSRAAQPFLGWNQKSGNAAAAAAVGTDAPDLTQPAIKNAADRFTSIFTAARNPNVAVTVGAPTAQAVNQAETGLNQSSRAAFAADDSVGDLMALLKNGGASAEQLGEISSRLGKEAAGQMSSKLGDRKLGQALFKLQDHVDSLVGNSITDPALRATYDAALPQYRTFLTLTSRPTLLNSATGDVNLNNLGKYLQKYDKRGYAQGQNTTPLYEAARFGQSAGLGSRPPPPILQPFKWATYHAVNNPVTGAITGAAANAGKPFVPLLNFSGPRAGAVAMP